MVFAVTGGTQASGYEISNSLRFNNGSNITMTNDPGGGSGSDGSRTQFSISMWVKRSTLALGDNNKQACLISASATNNFYNSIKFNGDDKIQINLINSGSDQDEVVTNAQFRDVSSWYHLFFVFDKTQAALADGIKLYVNGVQQTFGTTTYAQNQGYHFSRPGKTTAIGINQVDTSSPFHGYMAEIHFTDGQLKAHTDFGETNDNGVWIPKQYTGSYGTYGFYLQFKQTGTSENSSGIGADTSGNDEHFAVANINSYDVTTDTPTNNFTTINSLYHDTTANYYVQYTHGSLRSPTTTSGNSALTWNLTTQGANNGKWYAEGFIEYASSTGGTAGFGIVNLDNVQNGKFNEITNLGIYLGVNGSLYRNNTSDGSHGTQTTNDVIGVFLNLDDRELRFSKNGSMLNSGNSFITIPSGPYGFSFLDNSGHGYDFSWNFGNPKYSLSSAVSDPNGYGSFEYSPNDGTDDYYALCTKNLAEYG